MADFHENFTEHKKVEGPSNRNFGFTVGGLFTAIGVLKAILSGLSLFSGAFLLIGAALLSVTVTKPNLLTQANSAWMKLGLLLFHIVNPVIMLLMFAVCFVPAGIIMKLVGYDPMHRTFDKKAKSYWIKKEGTDLPAPMKYQF